MSKKLLEACQKGHLDKVRALLLNQKKPVNIHYQDSYHMDALMYAGYYGHLELVKYLLTSEELQEHAKIYNDNMINIMILAAVRGKLDICQYLIIEHHYQINEQTLIMLEQSSYQTDILHMIQMRDLHGKMTQNLSNSNRVIKQKKI